MFVGASAWQAASAASEAVVSCWSAMWRECMPVLLTIHSSLVSTSFASSSLVRTRSGAAVPHPVIWANLLIVVSALSHPCKDQTGVVTPEAKRIGHRVLYLLLASLIRHVVEIAVRVDCGVVDRGRQDPVKHRLDANHRLAAAPLLGYPVEMDQLIPLMLPIMLVIVYSRERWLKLGNGIAFFVLLFFFGFPWLLFIKGVPQSFGLQADQVLFLFWPVFAVVGLYWIRWWVIRPPRTWLDSLQLKKR